MKRNRHSRTAKMNRSRSHHEQDEKFNNPSPEQNIQNREQPVETPKKHGEHRKGK